MDPSVLAAAVMQKRNKILGNQKEEVVTTSDRSGAASSSFSKAPSQKFSMPKATAKPEKPADWKKPDKKYGGAVPPMKEGPGGPQGPVAVRPDLSNIGQVIVQKVQDRKERITTPGYHMKVRDSCPLPCCQYLRTQQEEEQQQKVIIKKVIRRRRPKQKQKAPEQAAQAATPGQVPSLVQATPPPLFEAPNPQELAAAQQAAQQQAQQEAARRQQEAERRRQEEAYRQQQAADQQRQAQEAERKRQEELQRQQAEQQRRQQEEAERQRQQQAETERQRQAAAAAAAPPAAPTQKVATFQNLGTDPAMAKAELYYESTRWGPIGHGDPPVSVGSFPGHRWFIVANGMYAKLFTVGQEDQQTFTF